MSEKNDGFCDEREEGMISDDEEDNANAKDECESSSGFQSNKDDYKSSHKDVKQKDSKTVFKKHSVDKNGSGDEEVEEGQIPASPYRHNGSSKSRSSRSRSRSVSRSRSKDSSKGSRSGSESKSGSRSRSRSRSRTRRKRQASRSRSRSRSRRRRSYSRSRSRSRSGSRSPYSGPIIKDYRRGRRGNFPPFNRFIRGRRPFRRGSFVPHHSYRNKYQTYSRSRSKSGSPKRRLYHEREFEKESRSPGTEEEKSEVLNPADIKKSHKQITQSFLAMLEEKQKKTRILPLDYPKFEKSHNYNPRQHGFVNTFATVGASESPKNSLSFELEKDGWQVIDDAETDSTRHKVYEGEEDAKDKSERKSTEEKNNSSDRSRKRRQSMSISGDSETDESSKLKSLVKSKRKSSESSSSEEEEPKHSHKEKEKEKESKKKSKHKKKEKKRKKKRDDSSSSSDEESKGRRRKSKKKKKHSKKYDSESDEDEEQDENADASNGRERVNEDRGVNAEDVEESGKKDKSKKRKKRSRSESSSDSDSDTDRGKRKRNKRKRKKKRSKKRRRDSSSSSSSDDDSDSSDSDDKKKKSRKRKKKTKKAKKTKKSKKDHSEKGKKKSSTKKKKCEEKPAEAKESEEPSFVWPTAMICYTTTKPSLQYCVNPKYMCESKVEQSEEKNVTNDDNCTLASEYERFLNEVNPNVATDEGISLEAQLREKLLKQMHHKSDGNEKNSASVDYLSPSEKRTMEKMKKQQQKEQEKEESLKRQESLKSAPLNTYYSTKRNASDTVVDMETSNSPKDDGNNMEPFSKSEKDITISFSDGKVKKDAEKKADVEDEKKLTAKELLDKIKKKKENEKVGDPPKPLRRFGNLPVIGKRPTKKTTANNDAVTTEQLIYNMNADYNYYVHYYMSTYGLDAYSAAYYAQYVMLTNGEYAYADTTMWMKHQGYVVTDATAMQQPPPEQPGAAVENSTIQNGQEEKVVATENENKTDENENKSDLKSESSDLKANSENNALTGNESPLPKSIEVVIPSTPLSATEMYLMNDSSKDGISRLVNSKSNNEDSGVGESPSPPPPPPPPMRPEITSFVTTTPITLPNGEQLPAGTTQIIVHPYPRTHPLVDNFTADDYTKAYASLKKKSDLSVQ